MALASRCRLVSALVVLASLTSSATASAFQGFTVRNPRSVPHSALLRAERAIEKQSVQVNRQWGTPVARFVRLGGWPIYFQRRPVSCNGPSAGCHYSGPLIRVAILGSWAPPWWLVLSHEVVETLVHPGPPFPPPPAAKALGFDPEVCDPVLYVPYKINGELVSDFVFPSYFQRHGHKPFDQAHALS